MGLDVDPHGEAVGLGVGEHVLHQPAAEPVPAVLGQQRDVDDADLVVTSLQVETTDGLAVTLHH